MSQASKTFVAIAHVIEGYTRKLTSGKNVVTQAWGNNTVSPFKITVGNVTVDVKTPSMPARKAEDVLTSLSSGKFSPSKSDSKNYQAWLTLDKLPASEMVYLLGYLFLSQLCGNGLSLITGVRVKLLTTIMESIPKTVKITVETLVDNGTGFIPCVYERDNITALILATSPRMVVLDTAERKGGKNISESPKVESMPEVNIW